MGPGLRAAITLALALTLGGVFTSRLVRLVATDKTPGTCAQQGVVPHQMSRGATYRRTSQAPCRLYGRGTENKENGKRGRKQRH
jgi:hypothetical protein